MRDELLEIYEAAERLGVSEGVLWAWVRQRRVTVVKLGPHDTNAAVRVRASEVERLIRQGTIPARPAAPLGEDLNPRG